MDGYQPPKCRDTHTRSLLIIGFGVLVCWVVVLGVVGLVGVWGGCFGSVGGGGGVLWGRRPGFGVLGGVEDPAGWSLVESEVDEAS